MPFSEEEKKRAEERAFEDVNNRKQEYVDLYRQRFGNNLNIDNARFLLPDYQNKETRPFYTETLNKAAGRIVSLVWREVLRESPSEGKDNVVWFVVGGSGSGKTTAVDDIGIREKVHAVFELVKGFNEQKVKDVLERDLGKLEREQKHVVVLYLHRPLEQAAEAVVERARIEGRTVSAEALVEGHVYSQQKFLEIADAYRNHSRLATVVLDNSRKPEEISRADERLVEGFLYKNEQQLKEVVYGIYEKTVKRIEERTGERIPESIREGLSQEKGRAGEQVRGASDGKHQEERGQGYSGQVEKGLTSENLKLATSVEAPQREDEQQRVKELERIRERTRELASDEPER